MHSFDVKTIITLDQVKQFGILTGDNGPIHSEKGVVQGGLILGMLPKWLSETSDGEKFSESGRIAVSIILNVKFRQKLQADHPIIVHFDYRAPGDRFTKINWHLRDELIEYCSGEWIIHKSFD